MPYAELPADSQPASAKPTLCDYCVIELAAPLVFYYHGTFTTTGVVGILPGPSFTTLELDFSAYTSFSASSTDTGCTTGTTEITLSTWFAVSQSLGDSQDAAEKSFFFHLGFTSCYYTPYAGQAVLATSVVPTSSSSARFSQWSAPVEPMTAVPSPPSLRSALPSQLVATTAKSSPSQQAQSSSTSSGETNKLPYSRSALPSQLVATTTKSSPSQQAQSPSTSPGETNKLIIGLVIAIVIPFLLGTMALAYRCFVRRRRRRKNETAAANQDPSKTNDDRENPQLYFQQKAELDDEQRRHEMEAVEIRHEMQGEDEIHEMQDKDEVHEIQDKDEIYELPAEEKGR